MRITANKIELSPVQFLLNDAKMSTIFARCSRQSFAQGHITNGSLHYKLSVVDQMFQCQIICAMSIKSEQLYSKSDDLLVNQLLACLLNTGT